MTISNTSRTAGPFIGNGITKDFPFSYKVFARGDVLVAQTNLATGVETLKVIDADYTVTLNNDQNTSPGGMIHMAVAPPVGTMLAATSNIDIVQSLDLTNQGGFHPKVINDALDRIIINIQQLSGKIGSGLGIGMAAISAAALQALDTVQTIGSSTGATLIGFLQTTGVLRTVDSKLRERVSVKDFGAKCDGVTDDTVAVQKAIDYCLSFSRAKTLVITGRCLITASLIINRLVDTTLSEFRIIAEGDGAGFYTKGDVTIFDSTLPIPTVTPAPQCEWITFEGIRFETSAIANQSYVLSKNFLRIKFVNCDFRLIRCILSTTYVQTMYFMHCNIRYTAASFINCLGLYDVLFSMCVIENGSTLVRCVDTERGTNGLRIIGGVIEGLQASIIVATGVSGLLVTGVHMEANTTPEFNLFAGTMVNNSVEFIGNYLYNPAVPANGGSVYYGPTKRVHSSGNTVFPGRFHYNVNTVTDMVSQGDYCPGGISDAANWTLINGVYRAGTASADWLDSANQITKDPSGMFGFGRPPVNVVRMAVQGASQATGSFANIFYDSAGNVILGAENDRQLLAPGLSTGTGTALVLTSAGYVKLQSSSRRYKENEAPFVDGLAWVRQCAPVSYTLKDGGQAQLGFISEDFHDERFVTYRKADVDDPDSSLICEGINYAQMVAPLTAALQEIDAALSQLRDEFVAYKSEHP